MFLKLHQLLLLKSVQICLFVKTLVICKPFNWFSSNQLANFYLVPVFTKRYFRREYDKKNINLSTFLCLIIEIFFMLGVYVRGNFLFVQLFLKFQVFKEKKKLNVYLKNQFTQTCHTVGMCRYIFPYWSTISKGDKGVLLIFWRMTCRSIQNISLEIQD